MEAGKGNYFIMSGNWIRECLAGDRNRGTVSDSESPVLSREQRFS